MSAATIEPRPARRARRGSAKLLLLAVGAFLLSSCSSMEEWTLFGYTTRSQHTRDIHTIRVPIFKNRTFVRDLEFELTEAVVKRIEARTGWKVVQDGNADVELCATVINVAKHVIIQNPLNEVREADFNVGVEIVWRDLRPAPIADPNLPEPGLADHCRPTGAPFIIQRNRSFIPELGPSNTSTRKAIVDDLAEQIVSMMETSW